jgi:hypothetical protein
VSLPTKVKPNKKPCKNSGNGRHFSCRLPSLYRRAYRFLGMCHSASARGSGNDRAIAHRSDRRLQRPDSGWQAESSRFAPRCFFLPMDWKVFGQTATSFLQPGLAGWNCSWRQCSFRSGCIAFGFLKSIIVVIAGRDWFPPHSAFSRLEATEITLFFAATLVWLIRFAKSRPEVPDRVAVYLFCFLGARGIPHFSIVQGLIGLASPPCQKWSLMRSTH